MKKHQQFCGCSVKTSSLCSKKHGATVQMQKIEHNLQRKLLLDVATVIDQSRNLLLNDPGDGEVNEGGGAGLSSPQPNVSTKTPLLRSFENEHQQQQVSSLDSSMALTILVLLTALFFMGFFTLYLRRFSADGDSPSRRRRIAYLPAGSVYSLNQKGKGLDISTVRSLPLVSYGTDVKQAIFSDCPICLSEFEKAEIVKIIPHCRHVFHPTCIDTWLASHVSCPFCRSTKFFKEENRLDVKHEQDNNDVGESADRSTVEDGDTWKEMGIRRICSWTGLSDRAVLLRRSSSF